MNPPYPVLTMNTDAHTVNANHTDLYYVLHAHKRDHCLYNPRVLVLYCVTVGHQQ